ncbi:hypothetical protein [Brevundimonas sp. Root1279]|uniref:hypothetical protein n=1 Tax=Brevundimonas sp. Root1279 TaxID=1736443 RepID=UPI000A72CF59|nr:hypothetical protein [Brevundimonas sp. Root1279]
MTEIARFADVYEAEIAAARLRADGFDPVLGGAEHVKANPLVLQALGGVNLSLPNDQADAGRRLLESLRSGAERIEDGDSIAAKSARGAKPLWILVAAGLGILAVLKGIEYLPTPPIWLGPLD